MAQNTPAQIITFYSYKGGTGRSMALANAAWILASQFKKVLVIDWDLEAPGLHRYFAPFLVDPQLTGTPGIIDFLRNFANESVRQGEAVKDSLSTLADITDYVQSLRWKGFQPGGTLDLVGAGKQDGGYATRVHSFNFDHFYTGLGGGAFLEAAKESMSAYDYVLIDSRTGVSDTSGICTVQMPETVVVCFTLNNQSIEGAASAAESIAQQRTTDGKVRVRILPVPMRTDTFEKAKLDRRKDFARRRFARFLEPLGEDYWKTVEVQYWPFYAYEEVLAVFGDKPNESSSSLLQSYEGLVSKISRDVVKQLKAPTQAEREHALLRYAKTDEWAAAPAPPVAAAPAHRTGFDLYLSQDEWVTKEATREALQSRQIVVTPTAARTVNQDNWADTVTEQMRQSSAFGALYERTGLTSWQRREWAVAVGVQRNCETPSGFPILALTQSSGRVPDAEWLSPNQVSLRHDDEVQAFARALVNHEYRAVPPNSNPFRGMDAYDERDAPIFFGRDQEIDQLSDYVDRHRLGFLRGASGVGKSSLVNAGLLPHMRRRSRPTWEVAAMTPYTNPFYDLASALVPMWSTEQTEANRALEISRLATGLQESGISLVRSLLQGTGVVHAEKILLVIDQAERLLLPTMANRDAFLRLVQATVDEPSFPIHFLLVVRPEAEAWFDERLGGIKDGMVLAPLTANQIVLISVGLHHLTGGQPHPWLTEELAREWAAHAPRLPLLGAWLRESWASAAAPPSPTEFVELMYQRYARTRGGEAAWEVARFVKWPMQEWSTLVEPAGTELSPLLGARLAYSNLGESVLKATVEIADRRLLAHPDVQKVEPDYTALVQAAAPSVVGGPQPSFTQLFQEQAEVNRLGGPPSVQAPSPAEFTAILQSHAKAADPIPRFEHAFGGLKAGVEHTAPVSTPRYVAIGAATALILAVSIFLVFQMRPPSNTADPIPTVPALVAAKRFEQAADACSKEPKAPDAYCAYAFRETGFYPQAILRYRAAIASTAQDSPELARLYAGLAYAQALRGRPQESLPAMDKAIRLSPNTAQFYDDRAFYRQAAGGDINASAADFRLALKLDAYLQTSRVGLADIEKRLGQTKAQNPIPVIRIALHYRSPSQEADADAIQAGLQRRGYRVDRPQLISGPNRNELRYTVLDDAPQAGRLLDEVDSLGYKFVLRRLEEKEARPRAGVFEIWLGLTLALPPANAPAKH